MSIWGTILTSGAVAVFLAAVVGLIGTLRTLNANKPITEATADEKQALANASSFTAQQGVITTLENQLKRQEDRAENMQIRMDAMEKRLEETEHQNERLSGDVERAEQQTRMAERYLKTCRERNVILSDWIEHHYATEHPNDDSPPSHLFRM